MEKTFEAVVNGSKKIIKSGLLKEIYYDLYGDKKAVAATVDGRLSELNQYIEEAAAIDFLYPEKNEEASRIFLRGLSFVMQKAVFDIFDNAKIQIEYILNAGAYCQIKGKASLSMRQVRMLEDKMKDYIKEGEPFVFERVTREKAVEYYRKESHEDKVKVLNFRKLNYFNMYGYKGMKNYFYGIMPPDASYLEGFSLSAFNKGFILSYPAPYITGQRETEKESRLAKVFAEAENWADILEVASVADLNELVANKGLREFIMVNEALHEKKLSELANNICERPDARIILIAGPSSSGKTTFANRLNIHLRVHGKKCHPISIDDYYIDRNKIPPDISGEPDFENITAIDSVKFNEDMLSLLDGRKTALPRFNFIKGAREEGKTLEIGKDDFLIIEGIHGLNERLTNRIAPENKYRIFISPLCPLNLDDQNIIYPEDIRLLRRLIRDKLTRGYDFTDTLEVWDKVRAGEFKFILPYMENADIMFDSSLLYEAAILKKYAYEELNKIKASNVRANYLIKFLNYFVSSKDDNEIPKNSILREFIGDSCFYSY